MVTQVDSTPTAKVTAGTLAGALATVLIFMSQQFGIEMDAGTGAAIAVLLGYVAAYMKKSRPGDVDH